MPSPQLSNLHDEEQPSSSICSVAFGLRNVADLDRALAEMARVVDPGGSLAILEFSIPRQPILKSLYLFYFTRILPLIGKLISPHKSAYAYLPNSVPDFPQRQELVRNRPKSNRALLVRPPESGREQ